MKITRQNPIEGYLSRYGDGDLSAEEKAFVDRYVEQHPEAAATLKSVQRTSDQLKEYFETMPPVPLSRLEAFAASLQNQPSHPSAPAGWSRSIPGFRDLFPVRRLEPRFGLPARGLIVDFHLLRCRARFHPPLGTTHPVESNHGGSAHCGRPFCRNILGSK